MKRHEVLRQHAAEIFMRVYARWIRDAIQRHVHREDTMLHVGSRTYNLDSFRHIYVVGGGKAGASMACAIEALLEERITQGWVNVKYDHLIPTRTIHIHEAGHPVPDEAGVREPKKSRNS